MSRHKERARRDIKLCKYSLVRLGKRWGCSSEAARNRLRRRGLSVRPPLWLHSDAEIEAAVVLAGSVEGAESELGFKRDTIYKVIRERELTHLHNGTSGNKRRLRHIDRDVLEAMYAQQGYNRSALGRALGVSRNIVDYEFKLRGIRPGGVIGRETDAVWECSPD